MSIQLLEPEVGAEADLTEAPAASAAATATITAVIFDGATRARLDLAGRLADTLEDFAASKCWDRLDPSLQRHLVAQARLLHEHARNLGSLRVVRAVEDVTLELKRLERRLDIAVDELDPADAERRGPGGLFLGDFTEMEADAGATMPGTSAGRRKIKARAPSALRTTVHRIRSSAERSAARASSRRIGLYITATMVLCLAAGIWNAKETIAQRREFVKPPANAFQVNQYLTDMQIFMPATFTAVRDRNMRVVVSKDWLLRSESQRQTDAASAHVWLANRNIPSMLLTWDDGSPLARYENGQGVWFSAQDLAGARGPGKAAPSAH